MSRKIVLAAAALLVSAPMAMAGGHAASGDAAAGERLFNQCAACHVVQNAAGDTLAGRNGRTGPNLYGVAGRLAGSYDGFRYSPALQALNGAGVIWTEEEFAAYIQDPNGYSSAKSGQNVRSAMAAQRMRGPDDAVNLYAFIASLAAE
jgi:cytochrome c